MELKVRVHAEEGTYWAEVEELPGCFASGDTLDELVESLNEAIHMYLHDDLSESVGTEGPLERSPSLRIEELRIEVPEARPKVPA